MRKENQILSILLALVLSLNFLTISIAQPNDLATLQNNIKKTAQFIQKQAPNPQVGTVSGDWSVMALARSSQNVSQEYYDNYYKNVVQYVKSKNGKLHDRKYTEYSRLILALTAIGKDPTDVGGYDLLSNLGDFDKVVYQGINGPIFALIAIDSKNYPMPISKEAKTKATRDMYVKYIIDKQIPLDGGFSLDGIKGDVDITAMAIQSIAKYKDKKEVQIAIDKALDFLEKSQEENGGYSSWGTENSESVAQVIMAVTQLKIDPMDKRFIKNGNTLMSNLLTFYDESGGFMHIKLGGGDNGGAKAGVVDGIATDQGMYAMIAYDRYYKGKNSYYDMTDVKTKVEEKDKISTPKPATSQKEDINLKTFKDISDSKNKQAIEYLATKNIINGITKDQFKPQQNMTRAEFSTIMVKALNIKIENTNPIFKDVTKDKWYFDYVNTAYKKGIIKGISQDVFNPHGKITKEEASVILYNVAKLIKKNTDISQLEINTYLPQFTDYATISNWSRQAISYMVKNEIISSKNIKLEPKKQLNRAEISQMIYDLLNIK